MGQKERKKKTSTGIENNNGERKENLSELERTTVEYAENNEPTIRMAKLDINEFQEGKITKHLEKKKKKNCNKKATMRKEVQCRKNSTTLGD